jgi:release factor glutamine methyltransferase
MNLGEALKQAERTIGSVDAMALMCHSLKKNRAFVLAHHDDPMDQHDLMRFELMVSSRKLGMPVAYLTGKREFYSRDFTVTPDVLIPRPETEALVDQALARLSEASATKPAWILDLGTGSGAIAITLDLQARAHVTAADRSEAALSVARGNAARLGASVDFIQSNWYAALAGKKFDLIVSNPPYVAADDPHLSQGDLRFEPQMALADASHDGLSSIRAIIEGAPGHLNPGGWLLFEHGYDQAEACRELLLQRGFEGLVSVPDLAGIARVAGGIWQRGPERKE